MGQRMDFADWPVCPVSETAAPQRMGTALTYARRYALFALVEIAGEDDLDAPDLDGAAGRGTDKAHPGNANSESPPATRHSPLNGHALALTTKRRGAAPPAAAAPALAADQSAKLRDRLLAELAEVLSADAMADWAHRHLPAKNSLCLPDAQLVETAFRERLAVVSDDGPSADQPGPADIPDAAVRNEAIVPMLPEAEVRTGTQADAETVAVPRRGILIAAKTIRLRDKDHRRLVSTQPCVVCGRTPADPHHLRFAQSRAMSRKVSDEFTVPVCRTHHRELHTQGNERLRERPNIGPFLVTSKRETRRSRSGLRYGH
jgi:hypothetical protein